MKLHSNKTLVSFITWILTSASVSCVPRSYNQGDTFSTMGADNNCLQFVNTDAVPKWGCDDLPEFPHYYYDWTSQLEPFYTELTQVRSQPGTCLNGSTLDFQGGSRCYDGPLKVATWQWENSLGQKLAMSVQCTSNGNSNTIVINTTTKNACFLRKNNRGAFHGQQMKPMIERGVSCAGCHQPFVFLRTPLIQSSKIEKALPTELKINPYSELEMKFNSAEVLTAFMDLEGLPSKSRPVTRSLGLPASLSGMKYNLETDKIANYEQKKDLSETEFESKWQRYSLDYTKFPALASSCGKCHELGANRFATKLASVLTGHCKRSGIREDCKGLDHQGFKKLDPNKTIHEFSYGVSPFGMVSKKEVFAEIQKSIELCGGYDTAKMQNCPAVDARASKN